MATQVLREGGLLKVVTNTGLIKYFCLGKLETAIEGDFVRIMDGNPIDYNDVSIPAVTSAEDLADAIGEYIYLYNTGQ